MRTILIVALVLVGAHLLFGALLLVVDAVHGINDQDFSYALLLLFYYLNYSAVYLLKHMGIEFSVAITILMALPQWILLSVILGSVTALFHNRRNN